MKYSSLRWAVLSLGMITMGAWAEPGLAAPKLFFERDDSVGLRPKSNGEFYRFTASLLSFGVETVEGVDVGPPFFGYQPQLQFGSTGITANTTAVVGAEAPGFSIDTKALVELDAVPNPDPDAPPSPPMETVFSFSEPITAFGLYVIQGGDFGNDNPTTFRLRNTVTSASVDVPLQIGLGWGLQNVFFFGVRNDFAFDQVTILESTDVADGMLYDNIVAGFVPEPGSMLLMMFGGACALTQGRRLRRD